MRKGKGIILCALVLLSGFIGMAALSSMKKPPDRMTADEKPLVVETLPVELIDAPVFITGYGQARAVRTVPMACEVPGKVSRTHPSLHDGGLVAKDELLFEIDSTDYDIVLKTGRERFEIQSRIMSIAEEEYLRKKRLFEQDQLSTRSGMDAAEKNWLMAAEELGRLVQVIDTAEMNLTRCTVRAPFNARVSESRVEAGQYVVPGQPLFTLVDDSRLEVTVSLDSRDARRFLQFDPEKNPVKPWFSTLKNVPCAVSWTENPDGGTFMGTLDRVIRFDDTTRTLTLSVSVSPQAQKKDRGGFPLVDGMFCKVIIPGKTLEHVARVPQWTVSPENTVYLAVNNRLKTQPVTLVRSEGEICFISGDLKTGDRLISTRLFSPLENTRLTLMPPDKDGEKP
ncbi:hypothetical protein JCM14469_06060 [Desulfatiferula olefinivorans]